MKKLIPQKLKNIYHLANAASACFRFGFPARKLKVIGVTGTNGKTTTVQMIGRILEQAGKKTAVASTINFRIGDESWVNKTKFTTLSAWQTQKFIKRAADAGCEYLVLEVSSHSLDQNRVWGIGFNVAVVTNVTREHLDYHKTMEQYRAAKLKLLRMLKEEGTAVVNLEMEKPQEFIDICKNGRIYGFAVRSDNELNTGNWKSETSKEGQISNIQFPISEAKNIQLNLNGAKFDLENTRFELNLPGLFNVENALAAVCVGRSQGIDLETCAKALEKIKVVPGRMDEVENDKGMKIIIDYALTPDSMEKIGELTTNYLSSEASAQGDKLQTTNSKVIWVFGSCGERDRGKRPIMGEIVSRYADYAIVTNEDPYHEDPKQIIDEVFAGTVKGGKVENRNAWRIFDRRQAIKKALELAQKGDIVLITGKGAEETMAIGDERISWNDKMVVLELLGE